MAYVDYTRQVLSRYEPGTDRYRDTLQRYASAGMRLLHVGCGHDLNKITQQYADRCTVIGVDPDPEAIKCYPSEGWHADAGSLPFQNNTFDLVFSEYVLEHLSDPGLVFSEVARVLRDGGRFVSLAPNFWSYKSLAAYVTPHGFHEVAVKTLRRDTKRETKDVYPTVFKANSGRALRRLAHDCGFELETLEFVDNGPTWFQRLPGVFEMGRAYHAALGLKPLAGLRCNIVATLRKSGDEIRSQFEARCVRCVGGPMEESAQGFHCSQCGKRYLRDGNVVRVLDI